MHHKVKDLDVIQELSKSRGDFLYTDNLEFVNKKHYLALNPKIKERKNSSGNVISQWYSFNQKYLIQEMVQNVKNKQGNQYGFVLPMFSKAEPKNLNDINHFGALYYDKHGEQFIIADTLSYNKTNIIDSLNVNKKYLEQNGFPFNNIISLNNVYSNGSNDCAINSIINLEALSLITKFAKKNNIKVNREFLQKTLPLFYNENLVKDIRLVSQFKQNHAYYKNLINDILFNISQTNQHTKGYCDYLRKKIGTPPNTLSEDDIETLKSNAKNLKISSNNLYAITKSNLWISKYNEFAPKIETKQDSVLRLKKIVFRRALNEMMQSNIDTPSIKATKDNSLEIEGLKKEIEGLNIQKKNRERIEKLYDDSIKKTNEVTITRSSNKTFNELLDFQERCLKLLKTYPENKVIQQKIKGLNDRLSNLNQLSIENVAETKTGSRLSPNLTNLDNRPFIKFIKPPLQENKIKKELPQYPYIKI